MGQARDAVQRFYDAFGRGDLDAAQDAFTPDSVHNEPLGGKMDLAAWRQYGEAFKAGLPDAHMEIQSVIEDGDRVAVEARFVGTHTQPLMTPQGEVPPSGRSIDLPFCEFIETRDGKIAEHRVYYDQVAFMTQLGLMPESVPS